MSSDDNRENKPGMAAMILSVLAAMFGVQSDKTASGISGSGRQRPTSYWE